MSKALLSIVFGVGLLTVPAATYDASAPAQPPAELRPAWTEFKWPFPVDQWGIGRAFVCKPAACGVEVNVPSNTVGRRANLTDCRGWPPISPGVGWP
jgi:hypothetical protein